MKKILLSIRLLLIPLLISTIVHAKTYNKGMLSTCSVDSVPNKGFGDLALAPSMITTFNAGTKSFSIEARYKNGTTLYAEKINNDLREVKINGTKVDPKEFPGYSAEVIRLEDIHAMNDLARNRVYRFDSTKKRYVQMYIDKSLMSGKNKPDQVKPNSNILSPEITSKLIAEVKKDSTQAPYRAYIVNLQTAEVAVKEFSRNEYLQFLYTSRKKAD